MADMSPTIGPLELNTLLNGLAKNGDLGRDKIAQGELIKQLVTRTGMGRIDAKREIKGSIQLMKQDAPAVKKGKDAIPVVGLWDDDEMADWAQDRLAGATVDGDPAQYAFENDCCIVRDGQRLMQSQNEYAANLNTYAKFITQKGDGESVVQRGVFAPLGVVQHNFNREAKAYPVLRDVKRVPHFTCESFDQNGMPVGVKCADAHGYNADTETYLDLDGLVLDRVSDIPTSDEVFEAKRLLMEEVYSDFPLGGVKDSAERLDRSLHNNGEPIPDMANLVALTLERVARPLINGTTPGYGIAKNAPGTGGSRLIEIMSELVTGEAVEMEDLPTTDEEFTKVKGAIVNEAPEMVVFDNVNNAIDSGPFASALTAPKMKARLLGSSRYVSAPVNHTTIIIGNNMKGTREILRRLVMIELNARVADPEKRSGWRHADLKSWVRANRPRLVWACLTLIQNWLAQGMKPWGGYTTGPSKGSQKGSFENWSKVMGGILHAASIRGFLENDSTLMSYGSTSSDNGVQILVERLATHPDQTAYRPGGKSLIRGHTGAVVSVMDELNVADGGDPLPLNGYGYSPIDNTYNHARLIKDKFREVARGTYKVVLSETPEGGGQVVDVEYEICFTEMPDPKSKGLYYWVMNKTKLGDDAHMNA